MRLLTFHPQRYRNLQDLRVIFTRNPDIAYESGCSIRFLIGVNGTGKSNLLRFLSAIFAALNEGYPSFNRSNPAYSAAFDLTYELRDKVINITSEGRGRGGITIKINGDAYAPGDIPGRDLILPSTVMIYSSGDIAAWRELLQTPSSGDRELEEQELDIPLLDAVEETAPNLPERDYQENISSEEKQREERDANSSGEQTGGAGRVFLVEQVHMPLAFLAASVLHDSLLDTQSPRDNTIPNFADILNQIGIREVLSFSLYLIPPAENLTPSRHHLLNRLYSVATIQLSQWGEQLWVFDLGDVQSSRLRLSNRLLAPSEDQGSLPPIQLFRGLVDLQDAGILRRVDVVVAKKHPFDTKEPDHVLLEANLSDGERAFLEQMSLIYLLRENECLFILDEPEIHFNDTWRRDLVNQIELTLQTTRSEVILTTHGSVTITDAYPEEVILLSASRQENVPLTLAAEPGEVLRSVFKAELSVGRRAERKITDILDQGKLEELETLLDRVGLGYLRFKVVEEIRRRVSQSTDTHL